MQDTSQSSEVASKSAFCSNFVVNLLLLASINKLWSAVNSLQILVYMPLFWVKFPANAGTFNAFLIDIATFDIVPSEEINGEVFVLPDDEPYNVNFQQSKIDSKYAITILGTIFYILMLYLLTVVIERIWARVVRKYPRTAIHQKKLHDFLYWGGLNTLAMEVYLDVALAGSLNVHTMRWLKNNPDLAFTNVFAICCVIFAAGYPLWIFTFIKKMHPWWCEKQF